MQDPEEILYEHDSENDDGKLGNRFSIAVYPHGIIASDLQQVNALFKAVITSTPVIGEKESNEVIKKEIVNAIKYINRLKFAIKKDSIKTNSIIEIKYSENLIDLDDLDSIVFLHPDGSKDGSFKFGGDIEGSKLLKVVDDCFDQRINAARNNKSSDDKIKFFELRTTQTVKKSPEVDFKVNGEIGEDEYSIRSVLDKSNDFAKQRIGKDENSLRNQNTLNSNFTGIYSQLIDDSFIAEQYYGLVRAFTIPITELIDLYDGEYADFFYDISVSRFDNSALPFPGEIKPFCVRRLGTFIPVPENIIYYYNGLRSYLISDTSVLFKDNWYVDTENGIVAPLYNDPYHAELDDGTENSSESSSDGIYAIVNYRERDNNIVDPIAECKWISGFNVVANNQSLSYHRTQYRFNDKDKTYLESYSSGRLVSESDLIKNENTAWRSSVLFAFKGENQIATRVLNKKNDSRKEDNSRDIDVISQSYLEDKIIQNQFDKKISFYEGTNVPLIEGREYEFYLRSVTHGGYYLATNEERRIALEKGLISPQTFECTLSLSEWIKYDLHKTEQEEYIAGPFLDTLFPTPHINSPILIGNEDYRNSGSNDYMDQATHIVLDLTKKERKEKRYLYPPQISFFNFRVLGNLSKTRLRKSEDDQINLPRFVKRCRELEIRSNLSPKTIQNRNFSINYLADLRSKQVQFVPIDLPTANYLAEREAVYSFPFDRFDHDFGITENYPFYNRSKGGLLTVVKKNDVTEVRLDDEMIMALTNVGIFKFHINVLNGNGFQISAPLKFQISILDYPKVPELNHIGLVTRVSKKFNSKTNINGWSLIFKVEENDPARKSLKFVEETEVLRLFHQDLDGNYNNKIDQINRNRYPTLNDEYPYELFLSREGDIDKEESLNAVIYYSDIAIEVKFPEYIQKSAGRSIFNDVDQMILKIKLSDLDVIELYTESNQFVWKINDNPVPVYKAGLANFKIRTEYDSDNYKFCFYINDKYIEELKEFPYPDFSYANIIINDKLKGREYYNIGIWGIHDSIAGLPLISRVISKLYTVNDPKEIQSHIKLNLSKKMVISKDEGNPCYRRKKVKLFSSSLFQAFYPNISSETKIGRFAKQSFEIEIPNNVKPESPVFDADILFMKDMDLSWRNDKSQGFKEIRNQQLLRITLSQDFMKEGPNLLGLVLDKTSQNGPVTGEDFSTLGEDVTKLSSENWKKNEIEKYLNLGKTPGIPLIPEVKKYLEFEEDPKFSRKNIINSDELKLIDSYLIDENIYQVLHLNPYYNAKDRKWQVILAFKNIGRIETFFARLILMKVAKGHGLKRENSYLVDSTNTNISQFTKPAFIPIYSQKSFKIENLNDNKISIQINPERAFDKSVHQHKLYVLMGSKFKRKKSVFNIRKIGDEELNDFVDLLTFPAIEGQSPSKVIAYKPSPSPDFKLILSDKGIKKLFIFEFELHDNSKQELHEMKIGVAKYLNFNPLFGTSEQKEGLRLINYVQFKL